VRVLVADLAFVLGEAGSRGAQDRKINVDYLLATV